MMTKQTVSSTDRIVPAGFALLALLIHLPVLSRYGYHHDELYFLACGQHLALGYVDHAPLVPWIARLMDTLFPHSLFALRLPVVLAAALAVFLTGLMARRLGGGRFAQAVACLTAVVAPAYLRMGNVLHLPPFELLFWTLASYLVLRIIQEDEPRLWPFVGLVAGVGLLNKHSMLFYGFGLVVALLLTPQRKHLRSPWLYVGGAIAVSLLALNLAWQIANGWPTVEFLRGLNAHTMGRIPVWLFALGQVLYLNPFSAPVWIGGLFFFFSRAGAPVRALGWIYVAVFLLLVVVKSKIYYLAPAYPPLLAAGGVLIEQLAERWNARWLRPATLGVLIAGGALLAPIGLPLLSIDATERYVNRLTFGAFGNIYELTGDLHGQFGWPERVAAVAQVYTSLSSEERARTAIYGPWYGIAGAIDYFGAAHGLPKAISGHMTYHLWGPPPGPVDTVIVAGISREGLDDLKAIFAEVEIAAEVQLENVNPWERRFLIAVCRKPKVDIQTYWPKARNWS